MGDRGKDSIMKLLLSGGTVNTVASQLNMNSQKMLYSKSELEVENNSKLINVLHKLAGYRAPVSHIELDHPYARPSNWKPENAFAKPMKTLFVSSVGDASVLSSETDIDIEEVDDKELVALPYDESKAKLGMEECERHVNVLRSDIGDPDWENHISREGWSPIQNKLFNKMIKSLQNSYLSQLAHKGSLNEPALHKISVDKTARSLRQIFGSVSWDVKYTQWIHTLLLDNADKEYLTIYLEALQTLKTKVPSLVERMLTANVIQRPISAQPLHELTSIIHKRPWDPISTLYPQFKTKRLPNDPILVMVPSGPGSGFSSNSRSHHWMANLSTLSTVICVYAPSGRPGNKVHVSTCLDQMLAATRSKLSEVRTDYGKKPIVLVGIDSGAALACQVALVENVAAVICIGFPLNTAEGKRGQPDDFLLNIQVPVVFIIGQNSSKTTVDEIEELREKLKVESSLIVVGSADDQLRINQTKKNLDGVTQSMVDKCVLDEIGDFLGNLMLTPYQPPPRPMYSRLSHSDIIPRKPFGKIERKRKITGEKKRDIDDANRPKKGRKPKSALNPSVTKPWKPNLVHQSFSSKLSQPETISRPSITQVSSSSVGVNIGNLATLHGNHIRNSLEKSPLLEKKGVQICIQGSSIVKAMPETSTITVVGSSSANCNVPGSSKGKVSSNQLTPLSTFLQSSTSHASGVVITPTSSYQQHIEKEGARLSSAVNSDLVEELTPDKILELPVFLDDTQLESDNSPMKIIVNKQQLDGARSVKTSIPSIKYVQRTQQPVKYTKIVLTKKEKGDSSGQATLFVEKVIDSDNKTLTINPRIRAISSTNQESQCYQ